MIRYAEPESKFDLFFLNPILRQERRTAGIGPDSAVCVIHIQIGIVRGNQLKIMLCRRQLFGRKMRAVEAECASAVRNIKSAPRSVGNRYPTRSVMRHIFLRTNIMLEMVGYGCLILPRVRRMAFIRIAVTRAVSEIAQIFRPGAQAENHPESRQHRNVVPNVGPNPECQRPVGERLVGQPDICRG